MYSFYFCFVLFKSPFNFIVELVCCVGLEFVCCVVLELDLASRIHDSNNNVSILSLFVYFFVFMLLREITLSVLITSTTKWYASTSLHKVKTG